MQVCFAFFSLFSNPKGAFPHIIRAYLTSIKRDRAIKNIYSSKIFEFVGILTYLLYTPYGVVRQLINK
jgi:hypothetical protein